MMALFDFMEDDEPTGPIVPPEMDDSFQELDEQVGNRDTVDYERADIEAYLQAAQWGSDLLTQVGEASKFLLTPEGQNWKMQQAAGYVDPAVLQAAADTTASALGQAFAGIDAQAAQTGNMGSSRSGLAQGSASAEASQALTSSTYKYYDKQLDRVDEQIESSFDAITKVAMLPMEIQQQIREAQNNDEISRVLVEFFSAVPAFFDIWLQGTAYGFSPVGSETSTGRR